MNYEEDILLEFLEQDRYLMSMVSIMKGLNPSINEGITYSLLFNFIQDGMPPEAVEETIQDIKDTRNVKSEDLRH